MRGIIIRVFFGALSYAELVEKWIGHDGFVRHWDERAMAPFLWNAVTRTFVTYDDPESIREKAEYVRSKGLGGMMFWELSEDRNDELVDVVATALRNGSRAN
jgi:chitinase